MKWCADSMQVKTSSKTKINVNYIPLVNVLSASQFFLHATKTVMLFLIMAILH